MALGDIAKELLSDLSGDFDETSGVGEKIVLILRDLEALQAALARYENAGSAELSEFEAFVASNNMDVGRDLFLSWASRMRAALARAEANVDLLVMYLNCILLRWREDNEESHDVIYAIRKIAREAIAKVRG